MSPRTWDGLLAGKSGVRKIDADWAADLPVKIAAQAAVDPAEVLERVEARRLDRCAQLAVVAALEAWKDAGYGLGKTTLSTVSVSESPSPPASAG